MNLSVAIMYHPSRTANAIALARRCADLAPILVADPDPDGPPSPLRTAKRAWAACPDGATHHLVLQDDVVLADDFADHLRALVRQHPDHGIALYVNATSQRNGYVFRRAAAVGDRWAPISQHEYTPTLGLLLPARAAIGLAEHLRTIPDDYRDDDEAVTTFCRTNGVPVVTPVPSLIDHGDLPSVAGNDAHGERHAVAFADGADAGPGYWAGPADPARRRPDLRYVVDLYDSRCTLQFPQPATDDPVDNLFGWYWHDWCELVDVSAEGIVAAWVAHADRTATSVTPAATALEIWAAGFLLGCDVADDPGASEIRPIFRRSVQSWLECGLRPDDRDRLDAGARDALIDLCLTGYRAAAGALLEAR